MERGSRNFNIKENNMKLIEQSHKIEQITPNLIQVIEKAGRVCYKSESKITDDSAERFIRSLVKSGHHSVLEHGIITVRFITDRGVTHELVRHRLASFSQESTRYVNYAKKDMKFIKPVGWNKLSSANICRYTEFCKMAELQYIALIEDSQSPQQARAILPNMLKTEIIVSANPGEWRHILKLRISKAAHPQIRELMKPLLIELSKKYNCLFGDI